MTDLEVLRGELSILLVDVANTGWDTGLLDQAIRIALADLGSVLGTAQTIAGLDGETTTTLESEDLASVLIGAAAYAARARALDLSEKVSLGQGPQTTMVEYGRDMLAQFRVLLGRITQRLADAAAIAAKAAEDAAVIAAAEVAAAVDAEAAAAAVAAKVEAAAADVAAKTEAAAADVAAKAEAAAADVAAKTEAAAADVVAKAEAAAAAIAAKAAAAAVVIAAAAAAATAEQSRLSELHNSSFPPYGWVGWDLEPNEELIQRRFYPGTWMFDSGIYFDRGYRFDRGEL